MIEATINANLNQCIKHALNIGETVYTNICSGTTTTVPWGTMDWALGFLVGALVFGFAAFTFALFTDRI